MADGNITKDIVYEAVAPDDFESMIELDRYEKRSTALRQDHQRDPRPFLGPARQEIHRFDEPFDIENVQMMPDDQVFQLQIPYVREHLEKTGQKIKFANEMQLWGFSSILHGEQGALNLSASLCHVLKDQGAQEYAANQTREEARHVHRLREIRQGALGPPAPLRHGAEGAAGRHHLGAGGLQEDHRHADAGRGPRHGRLRAATNTTRTRWRGSCSSS